MTIAKFTKSPLTEVVCGVEFTAPGFSAIHFGLFWQKIRERFPVPPQDLPPIGDIPLFPILPMLGRVWFESTDKQQLIQLQANRFHYNWRRQNESDTYPHFEEIYPKFEREWQIFQAWWIELGGLPLQATHYELTYLNQIDTAFGWNNPGDTSKIFTFAGKTWDGFLDSPSMNSSELKFVLPDKLGTLSVSLNQRSTVEDDSFLMFFELTSRSDKLTSRSDENCEITNWFNTAHEYTVKAFLDLIQEDIKKEWGFQWLTQ